MSEPAHDLRMTVPEFLRWDDGTETRYELVGGRPVAMAPAKDPHGRIAVSAALEMRRQARRASTLHRDDRGGNLDQRRGLLRRRRRRHLRSAVEGRLRRRAFPDGRGTFRFRQTRRAFEKVQDYIALPSVQEIWLIDSRKRRVQQWRRAGEDGWIVTLPLTGSASFESPSLGGEPVSLDDLYLDTGL